MENTEYVPLRDTTWAKLLYFSTSETRHWCIQEIMQCCVTEQAQYWTPHSESQGTKALQILGFSGLWNFMQMISSTCKINNKNYILKYASSTKL
jgi:hypothetical protein